jgi:outer membrane protein assembly factor BamD
MLLFLALNNKILINFANYFNMDKKTLMQKNKKTNINRLLLLLLFALVMSSCANKHNKLLKSNDNDAKYEAALKAYNEGDYFHSDQLFENLILYFRGRDKAEDVNMYYGKSLMGNHDYYSAGYQFENFVRMFPYSKKAEEALFLSAYCKYKESPEYSLDQTLTEESMKAFQNFINKYPESDSVKAANKYLDELRLKIIRKDYTNAYNYYKIGAYQAAQVSLKDFINKYSDQTEYRQNAMYYMVLADYNYAYKSIETKQKERWNNMIMDYERYEALFEKFTDKDKIKDLHEKYLYAKKQIETLN